MFTFNLNELFDLNKYYFMSKTLYYRDMKEPRYNKCERLNLN
jgi:hypothetical protein